MSDRVPTYRRHRQSGLAIVTLPDHLGRRRDVTLGVYGTPESHAEYARVIAEWEAAGRTLSPPGSQADLSINELIVAFWPQAEIHYRHADGSPTNELNDFRLSLKPLKQLYGHIPASKFGPLALKALRDQMMRQPIMVRVNLADPDTGEIGSQEKVIRIGLARGVINQRINRIRRMFRWAVENELVPAAVFEGLRAVKGLQRGRTSARETEPIGPVATALVDDTLAFLRPTVADMVRLQLATGMRPGEVVIIRSCDIEMSASVWLYRPKQHKTLHHGHVRVVPLGPTSQAIVRRYLKANTQAFLFSPQESMAAFRAEQRARRRGKVQPSQVCRKKSRPQRTPRERYDVRAFAHAIARACLKGGLPHWHPNQLRHTKATEIRREAGLDAARAVLGHRSPAITEVYAELDANKAAEVMERLG